MTTGKVILVDSGEVVAVKGVHPVADLFPMLDKEGLADLAASITDRGQEHPVVLDADDLILDGRNRFAACGIAGVDVVGTRYAGGDAAGYALTVNIARRHMTSGARAVVAAQAARLNGTLGKDAAENPNLGFDANRVYEANVILDWAPDLTPGILAGAQPLSVALKIARERKRAAATESANLSRLRADAADLASLVEEERLSVDDAIITLEGRVSAEQRKREADRAEEKRRQLVQTHMLCEHVVVIAQCLNQQIGGYYSPEDALPGRAVTRKVLADASAAIAQMSAVWKERDLP